MSNPPIDVVIPAAPKDYSKLPHVIAAVRKQVKAETIHIIAPSPENLTQDWSNVILHNDNDVLPYDRSRIEFRPNWVFQQMLKVFQNVTEHDWFLVLDADIIINRPMSLWTEQGKPIFNLGRDQAHGPYFCFNEHVLGFGKIYNWSFLSECVMYSKSLVRQMLAYCNLTLDEFWEKVVEVNYVMCCMADAELYGSYIFREHPGLYEYRKLHAALGGKYCSHIWTEAEIQAEIEKVGKDPHLISIHSWSGIV